MTRRATLGVPTFLPDATRAGVRGVSSEDLTRVGVEGVMVNAFHLLRRPGARAMQAAGGIHRFMGWRGPVLSDSGGFQVWSMIRLEAPLMRSSRFAGSSSCRWPCNSLSSSGSFVCE